MGVVVPPIRVTAAASDVKPPTGTPRGAVTYDGTRRGALWGGSQQVDTGEYVPELMDHYQSVREYERISRKTHVATLRRNTEMPLGEFEYWAEQDDASKAMWKLCAANLNLRAGRDGDTPDDLPGCLPWDEYLPRILDAPLLYGHHYDSIAINVMDRGPFAGKWWLGVLGPDNKWRPGVMPLPQNTLTSFRQNPDGSLLAVEQQGFDDPRPIEITADRLAAYVFKPRPGDHWGVPVLRDVYEAEAYRRVAVDVGMEGIDFGAIGTAVARYVGAPGTETPTGRLSAELAVQTYRGGGGVVMPADYVLEILVPGQSGIDPLAWLKHMEEKESNAFSSGVSELSTSGHASFALGDVLDDHRRIFYRALAKFAVKKAAQQLFRRLVDANEGPDAPCPSIQFDDGSAPPVSQADLKAGVEAGAIVLSHSVIAANHKRLGLPAPTEDETAAALKPAPAPVVQVAPDLAAPAPTTDLSGEAATPVTVQAAADDGEYVNRRGVTKVEAASRVDFKRAELAWRAARVRLVAALQGPRAAAAAELVAQVKAAVGDGDLSALGKLAVGTVGEAVFVKFAQDMVREGSLAATAEAHAQGVAEVSPVLDAALAAAQTRGRAAAITLGSNLAASAAGKALSVAAQGQPAQAVADAVAGHLNALTDADLTRRAGATLSGAMGDGRTAAITAAAETAPARIYPSAMLDTNCCSPCAANDGEEYASVEEADNDYPGGAHYIACEGGDSCRCLTVAVYGEDA